MTRTDTIDFEGRQISVGQLPEQLAPYGDVSRGLRKSKPTQSGLAQYVWRMARFHSGQDMHMPVTCQMWLRGWMRSEGLLPERPAGDLSPDHPSVREYHRESRRLQAEMMDRLEPVVEDVLDVFGLDDTKAARRWSKAGLV